MHLPTSEPSAGRSRPGHALGRFVSRWLTRAKATRKDEKHSATARLLALHDLGKPVWSPRDYSAFAREGVMQNAVVYRCVRMIAEAAASVPLLLYEGDRELSEHPLLALLRRPSPVTSTPDLLEAFFGFLLTSGNAYLEAVALDGELRELHALRPDRVRVVPGPDGWPEAYDYVVGGETVRLGGEAVPGVRTVLHLKLFHPDNDHYGLSPIEAAATAIDIHNEASRWNKALLDNSARPSGALVYAQGQGPLSSEQFQRLKAELEASFQGPGNAGRPLLLEGGLDWKPLSLSPRDMDFVGLKHAAAREIALALGVPPMLLGIPGDNTYSNLQEATRSFWRQTVLPLVNRAARALSAWLAPAWGGDLALRPDLDSVEALSAEREALWSRLEKAGFLTANEKRAAAGYDTIEGGDGLKRAALAGSGAAEPGGSGAPDEAEEKFNPHHDELGRFTTADGAGGGSRTPTPRMGQDGVTPAGRGPTGRPLPRAGIGHNSRPRQPPRPGTSRPSGPPLEGREATQLYRTINGMPPAASEFDTHTVANTTIDGKQIVGVNSSAPGYTQADRDAADKMRETLITKHPDIMATDHIGRIPNNALYHAETTALLRAARETRGSLAGRSLEVYVDRELCGSCENVLPLVALELGNPTVTFSDRLGATGRLRGGRWE